MSESSALARSSPFLGRRKCRNAFARDRESEMSGYEVLRVTHTRVLRETNLKFYEIAEATFCNSLQQ